MLFHDFFSEKFKQLEEEMSNNATASVENLKEEHESELQNYIEMCSGIIIFNFTKKRKKSSHHFFFFVK